MGTLCRIPDREPGPDFRTAAGKSRCQGRFAIVPKSMSSRVHAVPNVSLYMLTSSSTSTSGAICILPVWICFAQDASFAFISSLHFRGRRRIPRLRELASSSALGLRPLSATILLRRLPAHADLEDAPLGLRVRKRKLDLPVDAPRPDQSGVQRLDLMFTSALELSLRAGLNYSSGTKKNCHQIRKFR